VHRGFWLRNPIERNYLKDLRTDEMIILKWVLSVSGIGSINWIDLAQDKATWRTLTDVVMNLRFPENAGNFLTS
jgi:hypothetical protein